MSENVDMIVVRVLLRLGVSPNMKGFHYLRRAIIVYISRSEDFGGLTRELYPEVAKHFGATVTSVERAVRHAIHTGWHKRDEQLAAEIFFNVLQGGLDVPANTLFISAVGEWVRRELA